MLKKIFIGFFIFLVLILATMVAVPIIFKDDIQKALDEQVEANLNARVFYDTDEFSLSLFRSFPSLSLAIGDFGIVGVAPFEEDTLVSIGSFELSLNVMSVINGEQILINNVLLDKPHIKVKVLKDGQANYDIAKPSDAPVEEEAVE